MASFFFLREKLTPIKIVHHAASRPSTLTQTTQRGGGPASTSQLRWVSPSAPCAHSACRKGQSLGNGFAEGALKEVKAKIRTLQHELERALSRTVSENHDTLAWLLQHATSKNQWAPHWRGLTNTIPKKDGQELSTNGCTIQAESHVDCDRQRREPDQSRESCWREPIILGTLWLLGKVQTTTLLEHQMAWKRRGRSRFCQMTDKCFGTWSLSGVRRSCHGTATDPTIRVSMPRTPLPAGVAFPTEP